VRYRARGRTRLPRPSRQYAGRTALSGNVQSGTSITQPRPGAKLPRRKLNPAKWRSTSGSPLPGPEKEIEPSSFGSVRSVVASTTSGISERRDSGEDAGECTVEIVPRSGMA
jgi:hypothetical protein